MITIISGTNRSNSRSLFISKGIKEQLEKLTDRKISVLDLAEVPPEVYHSDMYDVSKISPQFNEIKEKYIETSDHWIIVCPEYNGSYTGALKMFIDALSVDNHKVMFGNKKIGLVGIASGRGGNIRGLDHLTTAFHYLEMHVMPQKVALSQIENHIIDDQLSPIMKGVIEEFSKSFLNYNIQ